MAKRKLAHRRSIANLGNHAKKRVCQRQDSEKENKENEPPSELLAQTADSCGDTSPADKQCTTSHSASARAIPPSAGTGMHGPLALELSGHEGVVEQYQIQNAEDTMTVPDNASAFPTSKSHPYIPPPTIEDANSALSDILALLWPRRKNGKGTKPFDGDDFLHQRMEQMRMLLWFYHNLPTNPYGKWNNSMLQKGDLASAIGRHLQSIGKYVRAMDVMEFVNSAETQSEFGLTKGICLSTAQMWMHAMDYRWRKTPHGQFVDGHERADVVNYRQEIFLPLIAELEYNARRWSRDGLEDIDQNEPRPRNCRMVFWWHDESVFYANDRRSVRWVHETETAVPQAKGEGASIMAADFVSADYGWGRSKDGTRSTRILFKPGKNREGYFTNERILEHCTMLMDIASRDYPDDDHGIILDNAPTHLKRADDALSARKMPKFPPKPGAPNFHCVFAILVGGLLRIGYTR
ncbi:hypothetical protein BKA93DRAFT_748077 [Sparassis latifolia]